MNKGPGAVFTHRPDPSRVRWRLSSPLGHQHQKKAVFPRLSTLKIQETVSSRLSNHQIQRRVLFRAAYQSRDSLYRGNFFTHRPDSIRSPLAAFLASWSSAPKKAVFPRLSTLKIQETVSSRLSIIRSKDGYCFARHIKAATHFIAATIYLNAKTLHLVDLNFGSSII
jgi:hypothetical protein